MIEIFKDKQFVNKLNHDLKLGAVICFVTDTVWGVGCLPISKDGVEKIYEIKGRDRTKPLILMSNNIKKLLPYINNLSDEASYLMQKYFPGAITIISEKSSKTPDFVSANKNTIGFRIPDNEFFSELCQNIEGGVLATTSANLSTQPSAKSYEQAYNYLKGKADYILKNEGFECKGLESTVVLALDNDIKVLRQGAIQI